MSPSYISAEPSFLLGALGECAAQPRAPLTAFAIWIKWDATAVPAQPDPPKPYEREEHRRRLEAGKWVCPTCQRYTYPEDGLTPGGECRPCLNYRQRTAAGAVPEQGDQGPVHGVFGRRRRA